MALVDTGAQCMLVPSRYRGTEPIWISGVTGDAKNCLYWRLRGQVGKAPHCDQPRGPLYPWHRLPQERVLQGPKGVPMSFWCSHCELELQYELESKAAKWYATTDIANAFFSIPLAAECRPQFAFAWRGVQYTKYRLPQGWKHSPTICHGLIQTALEKGDAPEHLQYIDYIIMWGNKAEEMFEKGKRVIQILLKAGFAIKKSKVRGPIQEIQFLGIKWQDGHHHVPVEVVNKITTMSPPANKKETQAFLSLVGSTSPLGTAIAHATLDVQRKHSLYTSCNQRYTE
ncbi:hypothetical protein QYF61_017498 [Mycteria americana]|uniref:ribonuclease H n=1 Tax=Mycteria americana TaxID=33587 RepID=A0AAN7PHM8_MYCAM|nr:hypothetical protein QYF61_017498 [Mycteria americana]